MSQRNNMQTVLKVQVFIGLILHHMHTYKDGATGRARDAFTHGPTGPGPRGSLKFLDLGGPEQNFEKPVNSKSPYKLTLQPCP